ncbi:MAG: Fic family protein [Chlorobi bacterium]|nr:Fic family protein [Chlorobiota bacterium]MBX7216528.1 Fic family protein [Candidatus Kapabacteria bacterium]
MPQPTPPSDMDALLHAISRFPNGASMEELLSLPQFAFSRRTLQRRLRQLVQQHLVVADGRARAIRYRRTDTPFQPSQAPATDADMEGQAEEVIRLSPAGKKIQKYVRQPIQQRKPVGYNHRFLDAYRPNETFYLPADTRQHLMNVGRPLEEHLPAGTYLRQIFHRVLIDLTWNSSRLEGNTYSLLDTQRLLAGDSSIAGGKDAQETQMILNHKAAIELLVEQADEIGFNRYTICNLHALLSDNLLADPMACGRIRARSVGIANSAFLPLEGPQLIEECFQQVLDTAEAILDPFEQAFFAMVHLPYLQPFEDVNKRVSRLSANIPLIRRNLCPLSFVGVPVQTYICGLLGVYELNSVDLLRDLFVWAYQRSSQRYTAVRQSLGQPDEFKVRYRELLIATVGAIVKNKLGRKEADLSIRESALRSVPELDRLRFAEVVHRELHSLHAGNIARYRLRPSEYEAWREIWE